MGRTVNYFRGQDVPLTKAAVVQYDLDEIIDCVCRAGYLVVPLDRVHTGFAERMIDGTIKEDLRPELAADFMAAEIRSLAERSLHHAMDGFTPVVLEHEASPVGFHTTRLFTAASIIALTREEIEQIEAHTKGGSNG